MHEVSLIENVIEIVMAEMPRHGITKVENVKLRIGQMNLVSHDALVFAFEVLSKGTPLENARLIIESVPTEGCCRRCGEEFIIEDWLAGCPMCGGTDIELISGKELEIAEFEGIDV